MKQILEIILKLSMVIITSPIWIPMSIILFSGVISVWVVKAIFEW